MNLKSKFNKKVSVGLLAGAIILSGAVGAGASTLVVGTLTATDSANISAIDQVISDLALKIRGYEDQEKKLVGIVNDKKVKLTALVSEKANLQAQLNGTVSQEEADALQGQIDAKQVEIDNLSAEITTLQGQLNDKTAAYDQLNADYQKLQTELQTLKESTVSVDNYYETYNADAPITDLQTDATTQPTTTEPTTTTP